MLVLSRRNQEVIRISDNIDIQILAIHGQRVVIGIDAPQDVSIFRRELVVDGSEAKAEEDLLCVPTGGGRGATTRRGVTTKAR